MINSTTVDDGPCPIQRELAGEVAKAVQRLYAAKAEFHRAFGEKRDTLAQVVELEAARARELEAVKALDAHKRGHGCGKPLR